MRGHYQRRFIVAGNVKEIARMREEIGTYKNEGIEIVSELDMNQMGAGELIHMIHEHSVYGVILSARHAYFEQIENVIKACELEGVEVWLVADFFATQISRTTFDEMQGRPLLIFRTTPESSWHSVGKSLLDFFGSLFFFAVVGWWLFPIIALVIKFSSPGPVFFKQQRSGQSGRPFTLYKFRTMVTNAEQYRNELERMNEMRGPVFKLTKDPRVTGVGKILRKYSLDELPQFWNVLRGDMSLVGPRPPIASEVQPYEVAHLKRLDVLPGITALWQVEARQDHSFDSYISLDTAYVENWSLMLDMRILARTIGVVFGGTGT